jgi:hypothetical protein
MMCGHPCVMRILLTSNQFLIIPNKQAKKKKKEKGLYKGYYKLSIFLCGNTENARFPINQPKLFLLAHSRMGNFSTSSIIWKTL